MYNPPLMVEDLLTSYKASHFCNNLWCLSSIILVWLTKKEEDIIVTYSIFSPFFYYMKKNGVFSVNSLTPYHVMAMIPQTTH